ncbi:hypothetical protein GLUCOINTEAF2_0203952 [Komagataeibacter intermedius AF2]|uniref:Uncharacterized protein n=1 Tax=Komagataeibacter intermedius AF2 TaxID=1458464 RepID=A0A0N1FCN6_9PROT|nr:hypothetical protein GLUCOINTEAF2_0203952 [Komagataeibacter intermedius AF2]
MIKPEEFHGALALPVDPHHAGFEDRVAVLIALQDQCVFRRVLTQPLALRLLIGEAVIGITTVLPGFTEQIFLPGDPAAFCNGVIERGLDCIKTVLPQG